jgi:hypothetical protein
MEKEIWNVSQCVVQAILCRGSILPKLLNMLEGKGMRVLGQVFSLENTKQHQGNDAFPSSKHFLIGHSKLILKVQHCTKTIMK